jgi:hypothetical protein
VRKRRKTREGEIEIKRTKEAGKKKTLSFCLIQQKESTNIKQV